MFCIGKEQLSSLGRLVRYMYVDANRHAKHSGTTQELHIERQAIASLLTGIKWAVLAAAFCGGVGQDVLSREADGAGMCS